MTYPRMNYTEIENSSNITRVGYQPRDKVLDITFKNGKTYRYEKVPKILHEGLLTASSVGSFFHVHIREKFKTVEVLEEVTRAEARKALTDLRALLERRVDALRETIPEKNRAAKAAIVASCEWNGLDGFSVEVTGPEVDDGRKMWTVRYSHHDAWRLQIMLRASGFLETLTNALGFTVVGDAD
jgi:hypothetical protein